MQNSQPLLSNPDLPLTSDSFEQRMEEVTALTDQLHHLMSQYKTLLAADEDRDRIAILKEWGETYRQGLSAAKAIAENAPAWVNNLADRSRLAADELHRLENEGGPSPTKEQIEKAEHHLKASRKLDAVATTIEQNFAATDPDAAQSTPSTQTR